MKVALCQAVAGIDDKSPDAEEIIQLGESPSNKPQATKNK
jgi:hypothetical protein